MQILASSLVKKSPSSFPPVSHENNDDNSICSIIVLTASSVHYAGTDVCTLHCFSPYFCNLVERRRRYFIYKATVA